MGTLHSWIRARWPLGAAAATLVGGYAALIVGSTTVAPALLVAAYCVAIPAAILRVDGG